MYINSINHFRALAILFIIAGHTFEITGLKFDSITSITIANLIEGGTSLFVFISGFLFHQVFYSKFKYYNFLIKKIKNVLVPYLVLSALPIVFILLQHNPTSDYFEPSGTGILNEYIVPALKYLVTGQTLIGYWYVPFIMVTFLISPLHMLYICLNTRQQLMTIFLLAGISVLIHRPIDNMSVLQSVVYFSPIYLIGITAAMNKSFLYKYLADKQLYLLAIVLMLALAQAMMGIKGNFHKAAFEFGGIDIMFIQKIAMCFFFMIFLSRFEAIKHPWIDAVAATSFTAFFLHPIILFVLSSDTLGLKISDYSSWLVYCLFTIAIAIICVCLAKLCKRVMPQYSRYIIGY